MVYSSSPRSRQTWAPARRGQPQRSRDRRCWSTPGRAGRRGSPAPRSRAFRRRRARGSCAAARRRRPAAPGRVVGQVAGGVRRRAPGQARRRRRRLLPGCGRVRFRRFRRLRGLRRLRAPAGRSRSVTPRKTATAGVPAHCPSTGSGHGRVRRLGHDQDGLGIRVGVEGAHGGGGHSAADFGGQVAPADTDHLRHAHAPAVQQRRDLLGAGARGRHHPHRPAAHGRWRNRARCRPAPRCPRPGP